MKKIDVSVLVTAHNEGIIAHKTMISILGSVEELKKNNISYEILVHIDNGTPETEEYFKIYENHPHIRIFRNSFGDLSKSRNYSIKQAKGEYIAITDADDLYSREWLVKFYNHIKGAKDKVARFAFVITFGGWNSVITDNISITPNEEFINLFDTATYGSPAMFHKSIYEKFPQRENHNPYGFEDWQWILDTKMNGIKHEAVPETALFYRRNPFAKPSLLNGQVLYRATLSPSKFFDFNRLKKVCENYKYKELEYDSRRAIKTRIKDRIYYTLVYFNTFKSYRFVRNLIKGKKKEEEDNYSAKFPEWLLREWREINKIEKTTFPDKYVLKAADWFRPNELVGLAYLDIVSDLRKKPDTLYFMPWVKAGGADKVFINTANELISQRPDWNIAMMTTVDDKFDQEWIEKISSKIDLVNLYDKLKHLEYEKQMQLMAMFISQNQIKRIVIANSKFAYDFAMRYKTLIKTMDIKIYVFAFASAISNEGRIGGFVHEELPLIQNVVYKIITDNSNIIKEVNSQDAIDESKFIVHHQFVNTNIATPKKDDCKFIKILWASRVHQEKLPEVLAEINKKLPKNFQIDVYGKLENDYNLEFFEKNNLNYKRKFNGIDDLPTDEYDIFLYTSRSDGMPNMLLEVASKGLPIIAPKIGGIGDFIINNETGILIDNNRDADAYLQAILLLGDSKIRIKLAKAAQKKLKSDFNKSNWKGQIKEIFDK